MKTQKFAVIKAAKDQLTESINKGFQDALLASCDLSTADLWQKGRSRLSGLLTNIRQNRCNTFVALTLAMLCMLWARNVAAFTVPAAGSFAYDIYDVAVNDILKGPIGFVAGIGFIVLCVFFIARQMVLPSILCIFAGIILIKADSIVTSLGCLIR